MNMFKKNLDTYRVVFNATKSVGVYGISLVKTPAIESTFIALSAEDNVIQLKKIDEEKRLLLGAVLIPDKKIFRKDGEESFNIFFDSETIRLASQHFLKNGYQKNSSLEHKPTMQLSGVSVVESWIKDGESDKSTLYGLDVPDGTWLISMHVEDDDLWKDYVETGLVKGFSIDGLFDLQEIQLNSNTDEMKFEEIKNAVAAGIKEGVAAFKAELGKVDTTDGEVTFNFEGDTLEAGKTQITMTGPDGELPVPDGSYQVDIDGVKNTVAVKDSIVDTITPVVEAKDPPKTDETVQMNADGTPKAPAAPAAPAAQVQKEIVTKETIFALAKEMGSQMEKGFAAIEAKMDTKINDALEPGKLIELTKAKDDKPKAWEDMSALERRRANKNE